MAESETMGWHRVCLNTIVRKEKVLDSERLRILPMGSRVNVVEKSGRRVRIDQPIVGWCSLQSSNGDTILKPLDANQAQQKVAATPRSGQAAVTNLESKVKATQAQIDQAKQAGKDIQELNAEKDQLQGRIADLVRKNEQQQKVFEDWKAAAENATTTQGTVPTDMENIQFRNGDAVMLSKACPFNGIVVVRCVAKTADGAEMIGCEYKSEDPQGFAADYPKYATDGTLDGEQKFTPNKEKEMIGIWLTRKDMKSLLPTLSLLQAMEHMEQENTDLLFYKRTAEGMIKLVKQYNTLFLQMESLTVDGKSVDGEAFAKDFMHKFTTVDIVED